MIKCKTVQIDCSNTALNSSDSDFSGGLSVPAYGSDNEDLKEKIFDIFRDSDYLNQDYDSTEITSKENSEELISDIMDL